LAINNPALEDGFDENGSNVLALTTALKDDGYATSEIPKSGHINTIFKELYRYMQFLKSTGVSQWDNSVSYQQYARIMRNGVIYSSNQDANQGNDPLSTTLWTVDQWRFQTVTHNIALDSDYTLTADQNLKGRIVITDSSVVLSGAANIIVDDNQKSFIAQNNTVQDLTFKTSGGTGIIVSPNVSIELYNDGTNVVYLGNELGVEQSWVNETGNRALGVAYTNNEGMPIQLFIKCNINTTSLITVTIGAETFDSTPIVSLSTSIAGLIVPPGETYSATVGDGTLSKWEELK